MQQICRILIKVGSSFLHTKQSNKLKLSKQLLNSLDKIWFNQKFLSQTLTFTQLNTQVSNYYEQKFNEKIKQSFFQHIQIDIRFVNINKLIFDIALNGNRKEEFLNVILQLSQNQKNQMMQFVGQVVRRDQFIDQSNQHLQNFTSSISQLSHQNQAIQEKYIELKNQYDQLERKYYQLLDNDQALKKSHQKVTAQFDFIKQQKLQLLDQLGLHKNCGFHDIIDKYKKQVLYFGVQTQRLHKQLQQKVNESTRKQKFHQQLLQNMNLKQQQFLHQYEQKIGLSSKKLQKCQIELEKQNQKQQQYRFQITRLKDVLIDLRKQIQNKNAQIYQHQKISDKFNMMKKLHLKFRKQMIDNYRNPVVISNTTIANNAN